MWAKLFQLSALERRVCSINYSFFFWSLPAVLISGYIFYRLTASAFLDLTEMLKWDLTCFWEMGGCEKTSVAGTAHPWGHICVLCSLSGNILIWSLCFYKTGQDLLYPEAFCVTACAGTVVGTQEWCVIRKLLCSLDFLNKILLKFIDKLNLGFICSWPHTILE